MPKKAILLVPMTYNDGSAVPSEVLHSLLAELFALSGGHSSAGTVHGAYRMADGTQQTDRLEQIWVAYEDSDKQALRALAARFCAILGQESIYLEFTESMIEFVGSAEAVKSDE